ncbi:MAG: protein kinase [Polyangiaceae bacterium]
MAGSEDSRDDAFYTAGTVPAGRRMETLSRANTLPRAFASHESEPRAVDIEPSTERFDALARYHVKKLLGEGGMGEVRLCGDAFIGRDVAMKVNHRSHGSESDARARFLREARVQGQLEHPAVVPVYDLGVHPNGEVFFTMKRIVGRTLEEIIAGLRRGDADTIAKFPLRRLLSALSQVSLALAFAHSKGVVHRDLKPANLMLGDFGEVYVLDWGVAKIASLEDIRTDALSGPSDAVEHTQAGALLGTPGYMSPEQARGDASVCDGRADIYALGVVLYEMLTLEPLHGSGNLSTLIVSALKIDGARPTAKNPTVPSALDEMCARATRLDPAERYASCRDLYEAIEAFLDGEKDRERQIAMADAHADRAEELIKAGEVSEATRAEIMRELGAALALHPVHKRARRALIEVLLDEPDTMPPEAEKELDSINQRDRERGAIGAVLAYAGWILMLPLVIWMGVREHRWLIALSAALFTLIGYLFWMGRTHNARPRYMRFAVWGNFVVVGFLSVFFGPLLLVPQAVTTVSASLMVSLRANKLTRLFIAAAGASAVFVPILLIVLGVVPSPYTFENGSIVIHPIAVNFTPVPTVLFLFCATAFSLIVPGRLIGSGVEALIRSERRTVSRAHRLRNLFPATDGPLSERT